MSRDAGSLMTNLGQSLNFGPNRLVIENIALRLCKFNILEFLFDTLF